MVKIKKIDEVYMKIEGPNDIVRAIGNEFAFQKSGYQYMKAYKYGQWDGYIRFMEIHKGNRMLIGLLPKLIKLLDTMSVTYDLDKRLVEKDDSITDTLPYEIAEANNCSMKPRDYQAKAVEYALRNKRSLIVSPTASGKSFIAYLLSKHLTDMNLNVLIVVPTINLVTQMESDFQEYNENSGQAFFIRKIYGGEEKKADKEITITTWQSLKTMNPEQMLHFDAIIGDEAHKFQAKSLTSIMQKLGHCKYRIGFTGTLPEDTVDYHQVCGLFSEENRITTISKLIESDTLADFAVFAAICKYTDKDRKEVHKKKYQEEIDFLLDHEPRNKFIKKIVKNLDGNTLVSFQFVEKHGEILYNKLKELEDKEVYFLHGKVNPDERERIRKLTETKNNVVIVASLGVFQEGINIKSLENLILTSPTKAKVRLLQVIGRVLRRGNGKTKAKLIDLVDDLQWGSKKNYAMKHFEKRFKIYSEEGFKVSFATKHLKGKFDD